MSDTAQMYEKMYHTLFHAMTTALDLIKQGADGAARQVLIAAQREAEEIYLNWEESSGDSLTKKPL